jgi:PAS domain S-box-containing protein
MDLLTLDTIKSFLTQFAEHSENVYWLGDPDFTYLAYVSPAFEKIWGRQRQDVYNDPRLWITYLHPEDQKRHPILEMKEKISQEGLAARFIENYRIVRPDGEIRWMIDRGFPVCDANGKIVAVTGVAVDITEQKNREKELENAKQAADKANIAKSEFIANISHDIRTPITGILGLAQSLHDNATNIEAKNDAATLISSTHELLTLLNEIIDVIGLESGKMEVKEEDFSLRDLVTHIINLIKPATKHKKLVMSLTIEDAIPDYLYGNRRYLNRVLLNVLSNAVKFTEKGSIDLTITQQQRNSDQIELIFVVRDTGIGIEKNKQNLIFQHFSRLNPSYQGIYKGSGLGLYSAKQYLHIMQGSIGVNSEEGKGSTFTITVPFLISKQKPKTDFTLSLSEAAQPLTLTRSSEYHETSGATILAVEDSPLAARMLQQMLQKLNCTAHIVNTGEEAINAVINHDYDLVLMDIGLPGIDGFETTNRIRQLDDKFKAHVPIIALTAHIAEQMRQQCLAAGMQDMLTKPVSLITMQQAIEKHLLTITHSQTDLLPISEKKDRLLTIDLEDGANIGGGDIAFAKKMLAMFIENLPSDIAQIEVAYMQDNLTSVGKLIHKMYGSLCYCGIPKLRNLAKRLQLALKEGLQHEVDLLMKMLTEEGEEVLRVWRNLKDVNLS